MKYLGCMVLFAHPSIPEHSKCPDKHIKADDREPEQSFTCTFPDPTNKYNYLVLLCQGFFLC